MQPSKYQQAIFQWVQEHQSTPGALIVQAVAGSGKTTTIVKAAAFIPEEDAAVFLAFNRSIADELASRLPRNIEAKTLNGIGYRICGKTFGRTNVDANKTRQIARELGCPFDYVKTVSELVAKAKAFGMVPPGIDGVTGLYFSSDSGWTELAQRFQIDLGETPDLIMPWLDRVLSAGIRNTATLDYDDQMYLPVAYNLPAFKYDWVIVDEAQDLSPVQHALLRRILKTSGRLIAVGDARQAIYGFRGADSDSLFNLQKAFKADQLPLTVTYRCAAAIVREAQAYLPELEARPDAPEGAVLRPESFPVRDFVKGDMVVCRNTAPVIKLAYKMINQQVPVNVQGRDIGVGLVALVQKLIGKGRTDIPVDFEHMLSDWMDREVEKALEKEDEAKADMIQDKGDSILAIFQLGTPKTIAEFAQEVDTIFAPGNGATLSTVHRSKGLEADRVFILEPSLMPSKYAKTAEARKQEDNLVYVAITRAKSTLVWLPYAVIK